MSKKPELTDKDKAAVQEMLDFEVSHSLRGQPGTVVYNEGTKALTFTFTLVDFPIGRLKDQQEILESILHTGEAILSLGVVPWHLAASFSVLLKQLHDEFGLTGMPEYNE